MNDFYDQNHLSENGLRRREEILQSALGAAQHRRWRRQSLQVGAFAAMAFIAFFITAPFWRNTPPHTAIIDDHSAPAHLPTPRMAGRPEIVVTNIQTDPTLLQRLAVRPQKPTWKLLSDDDLLKELADAGHPAGLDYSNDGPVVVLYRKGNP